MHRLFGNFLAVVSYLAYGPLFLLVVAIGEAEIYRGPDRYCCGPSFYPSDLAVFTVPLALLAVALNADAAKRLGLISGVLILYQPLLWVVFDGLLRDYVLRGPMPSWATFFDPFELLLIIACIMVTTLVAQGFYERRQAK